MGKTTIATKFPKHLLLAFEKGYNAIPGAMAKPIDSWSTFRKTLRQLKNPQVKEKFETIIIDTADIAYDYCEQYICDNAKRPDGGTGVDSIGDVPYGKGYTLAAKEFDDCLRSIVQMDYGLVLISHSVDKTFKDEQGKEYNQIVPTLGNKARNIVDRMVDIIGYSRVVDTEEGSKTLLFMRGTPRYIAGSRFRYTPDYIDFNYNSLVKAISEAIDAQAKEDGEQYFTDARTNLYSESAVELDFDALMLEFTNTINNFASQTSEDKFAEYWSPRITQVIEKYLGKGQKISQCAREQVEALSLIVDELKELLR